MPSGEIKLPQPLLQGGLSLEQAIARRRSERSFTTHPLTLAQVSQLMWAAQGITEDSVGLRAAPSAGALYPLDVYLVAGEGGVEELAAGVFLYLPHGHALRLLRREDTRSGLGRACLRQRFIALAPVVLVLTAEYSRITEDYGDRGMRYAHMEAGHVGQNVALQALSLGLGSVMVGAFHEHAVAEALGLPERHRPLYVIPVGYR